MFVVWLPGGWASDLAGVLIWTSLVVLFWPPMTPPTSRLARASAPVIFVAGVAWLFLRFIEVPEALLLVPGLAAAGVTGVWLAEGLGYRSPGPQEPLG